jgi:hypothetical protein
LEEGGGRRDEQENLCSSEGVKELSFIRNEWTYGHTKPVKNRITRRLLAALQSGSS